MDNSEKLAGEHPMSEQVRNEKLMKTPFSPGPWHAWMVGKIVCVLGKEVDHHKPVVHWQGFDGNRRALAKQYGNAHLIAASPELYDALFDCAVWIDYCIHNHYAPDCSLEQAALAKAERALAKARGER